MWSATAYMCVCSWCCAESSTFISWRESINLMTSSEACYFCYCFMRMSDKMCKHTFMKRLFKITRNNPRRLHYSLLHVRFTTLTTLTHVHLKEDSDPQCSLKALRCFLFLQDNHIHWLGIPLRQVKPI